MKANRKLYVGQVAVLAAVYYGAAKLGLSLAFETASVTAVWAPTGIALAALVLFGFRLWPGVALGALLANAWTGVPALTVLGITAGNTLEALVGAYLLVRVVDFRPSLERVRDVLWLVVCGAIVSTAVSATIGTASLLAGDEIAAADYWRTWRTWWLGDMGGDLLIAPALMVAVTHWPFRRAPGRPLEAVVLAALGAAAVAFTFTRDAPLTFLLVPIPVIAAFRFWQPGAVASSLLTAMIAIPLTEDMQGPFAGYDPDERLLFAQMFNGAICLLTLALAAVITERQRALDSVRRLAETLQEALIPANLPVIEGVEAAVEYQPVGDGQRIGGDFYELIENEDGSIDMIVGDALGKGAIAAADTALARYTLRAAALHVEQPSDILAVLNEAMLRHKADHPCTVAFARVERGNGGLPRITFCLAGHPQPLIVRKGGAVEAVGVPAPPLGVRPGLALTDHAVDLAPGDTVVVYTDGLTDAYAPERILGADELAAALRPAAAGSVADLLVAATRAAIPQGALARPRDDILVLALRIVEPGTG